MRQLTAFDIALVLIYIVGVTWWGARLGKRQKDSKDYFLADHAMPWWAVCFSIVATETSVLTPGSSIVIPNR